MSNLLEYKGHKLLDDGNAPDVYFQVHGHDILDDAIGLYKDMEASKPVSQSKLYGNLYVALRRNYANAAAEQGQTDPDVEGKSNSDFRQEIGISDFLKGEFIALMNGFVSGGKKAETAETPSPEEPAESPAPSSTPSPSPKEN